MVSLISDADIYVKNLTVFENSPPTGCYHHEIIHTKGFAKDIYICELTKVTTEKTSLTQAVKKEKLNFNKFAPSKG